jgi:putative intracellular protease/amidase
MLLTSHDRLGNTGRKTGFWLEEFAAHYFVLRDAGGAANPRLTEGRPTADRSQERLTGGSNRRDDTVKNDQAAQRALSQTVKLADMRSEDFDTIFYVGGHGPMWDLADNPDSIALIESFYNPRKPVAAVRHSRAVFHRVT